MAQDVVVLLEYVGWTGPRELHVVGASLGGMIAQGERSQFANYGNLTSALQSWPLRSLSK